MSAADLAARQQVAAAGQQLLLNTIDKFKESTATKGRATFRSQLLREIDSAGQDYAAAARYRGNIPRPAEYNDRLILDDTAAGAPAAPLHELRQRAMLHLLKSGLEEGGESLRLIDRCVYFSGYVGDPNQPTTTDEQAILLLDRRWGGAPATDDVGSKAEDLFAASSAIGEERQARHILAVPVATGRTAPRR